MELQDFWRLIIRNFPIMLASILSGLVISLTITLSMTPVYQATSQIFVSTPSSSLDISALATGSSFSQQRVKSYSQIINGPTTLNPVIKKLGLNETAYTLGKRVSASAPLDTVLITIKVSDESAALSARIANEIALQFAKTVRALEIAPAGKEDSPVKISTVKEATIPKSPSSPKVALNILLGIILGIGLGLGISIIRQVFDTSIKTEDDLFGLPLLTAIPFDNDAELKPLLTQIGRYSLRSESYRQLRTNLQFIRPDSPPKAIAITSSMPGEGKSTSSINLALAMHQAGINVVLVEADMRRPKMHEYLNIQKNTKGLSDLLSGKHPLKTFEDIKTIIFQTNEGLNVISAGVVPPNPAELLNSTSMASLIQNLKNNFEFVIIDCPPLLPITDAALISAKSDGVLLIVKASVTRRAQLQRSIESVMAVGSSVLGVELNMVPQGRTYYDYGYYSYGGKKYGGRYGNSNSYEPKADL